MAVSHESTHTKLVPGEFAEEQLNTLLDLISDGIWDWNANTGHVYRNPGWYRMLGHASHSLDNTVFTWERLIHPEDYPRVMAHFEAYLNQQVDEYRIEYRCRRRDGSYLWVEDRGHVIARNADGSVARMLGAHRDIDDRKRLVQQLEQKNHSLEALVAARTRELSWVNEQLQRQLEDNRVLAERDALTLVANRYRLEKVLRQECERSRRFRQPLSLVVIDLDDFKLINDRYGHVRGDRVLLQVVECIKTCLRSQDLLARWGGDEFMIVMPHSTQALARERAECILQQLSQLPAVGEYRLTASFGVAEWANEELPEQLVNRADQALYSAKAAGKNRVG